MLLYCMKCLKTIHDRGACGAIVKNNLLPPRCGSFTNLSAASPMAMNTMSANKTEPGLRKGVLSCSRLTSALDAETWPGEAQPTCD